MKIKLLATLASVLMAGTALAQNPSVSEGVSRRMLENVTINHDKQLRTPVAKQKNVTTSSNERLIPHNVEISSMQKVAELDGSPVKRVKNGNIFTIDGQYTVTIGDYYWLDSSQREETYSARIYYDNYNGCYMIDCSYFPASVGFEYDSSTKKMNFFPAGLGTDSGYYIAFYPFYWDYNLSKEVWIEDNYTVQFNEVTGVFKFDPDHGFCWPAFTDRNYQRWSGQYFDQFDFIQGVQAGGGDHLAPVETWNDAGTAVLIDGWVLPNYLIDQKDVANWVEVPVQQSSLNNNLYRLVNPYQQGIFKSMNKTTSDGYIKFDVSDADHVVFDNNTVAGYVDPAEDITTLYAYNMLSLYMGVNNVDASAVINDRIVGSIIPYTTYKNGIVDLGYLEKTDTWDACFGLQNNRLAGYQWGDGKNVYDMTARIVMPGGKALGIAHSTVEATAVSDKTATISFDFKTFNLASTDKVTLTVTAGRLYTKTFEISGTHADVNLDGLTPNSSYTLTLTLDAKSGNSTVATSFPTTVTFRTLEEITVPDPEIDAPAYVMVGIDENIDLKSYFAEVEVAGWTTSESNVAAVSGGVVTGKNYGEAIVTATRSQGGEWAAIKVLVCPEVTVLYPEGVETSHLVGYGSPVDILLDATDGWRVCTASVEGRDITAQIDESGRLLSNMTVNDDTLVNIVTAKTSNPQWADNIRIVVDGRNVTIKGTGASDKIYITNYRDQKCVYDWTNPEIPFSEGGVFNVKITQNGQDAFFLIVVQ